MCQATDTRATFNLQDGLGFTIARASWATGADPAKQEKERVRNLIVWRKEFDGRWRIDRERKHEDPEGQ